MNFVSVCKNVIASNNKRKWVDPDPSIRIAKTASGSGKSILRANEIGIKDSNGKIVARVVSTTDGNPVLKCGAKVAIITDYDVEILN